MASVSPNGRYFLDQYGKPLLREGDSPWALMTRLSPLPATFTTRAPTPGGDHDWLLVLSS